MSKAGDCFVACCLHLHRFPSLILCFVLILLQAVLVDYYLINHLSNTHLFWTAGDLIVLILVIVCFRLTSSSEHDDPHRISEHAKTFTVVWVTWVLMQSLLAAKTIVICSTFSTELEEEASFFGPNTLKTAIALGSCIFALLLASQHDAPPSSDRRRYIEELTGTVLFDILDTADILDVLFDADARPGLSLGVPELVLSVATLNLLLPTVPLITLSKTQFGHQKLRKRMIYMHRLLLVLAVNVPNLITRMILWHGFSVGISPFTLKNIIIIAMTAYEFYEHKKEKFEQHEREAKDIVEEAGRQNGNELGEVKGEINDNNDNKNVNRRSRASTSDNNPNNDEIHFDIESRMVTSM